MEWINGCVQSKKPHYYLIVKLNIKKIIIYIISFLPDTILEKLEKIFSISRGKGFNFSLKLEFRNFLKFRRKIETFVDIGSNRGLYTDEILKIYPNATGYLFEPDNYNYQLLKKKYKKYKKIFIINNALSNKKKVSILYANKKSSGQTSLLKRNIKHLGQNFKKIQKVKVIKMSTFFNKFIKKNIDFCKIDVEGAEYNCLKGFEKKIKFFKYIQFEFNACNVDSKIFFRDFWYFFKNNNFKLYRLTPSGPTLIKKYIDEDEFFGMNNFIAENISL